MEQNKEDNEIFFLETKRDIDYCLSKNEFKKAFVHLVLALEKYDDNQNRELINHYSKYLSHLGIYNVQKI
jgi:hypothetical protein